MRPPARAALRIVLGCVLLGGCAGWHTRPIAQPGAGGFVAKHVRVTRVDGAALLVADVRVRGDSLFATAEDGAPVALALAEVRRVEVRRPNELAAAILATFAAAAVAVLVLVSSRAASAC